MSANTFAWLVPLSLLSFAVAFLALRVYRIGTWWWGAMFALGAFAFASSILPAPAGSVIKPLLEDVLFVGAFFAFAGGVAARIGRRPRFAVLVPVASLSVLGALASLIGPRSVQLEVASIQIGIVLLLLESARTLRGTHRHLPDRILFALVLFTIACILAQTLALGLVAGPFPSVEGWHGSGWALALQASGATIGVLLAVAIFVAIGRDMVDDLHRLSQTDHLTGALNRRGFDQACEAAAKARRTGEPMSLVLIDIDHFKRVNDQFGHWAGDGVLCAMTEVLQSLSGPKAKVARLGGEEFAVLLPGADLSLGRRTAESIRTAFTTMHWPEPIGPQSITASFGVTDFAEGETLLMASRRADRLLYVAKNHGRDQVCFCSSNSTILPPDPSGIGRAGKLARFGAGHKAA